VDIATLGIKIQSDGMSQAQSGLDGLTRSGGAAESAMGGLGAAATSVVGKLAAIAAAAGGLYAVERAFKAGIQAVDDYQVRVIGIAATWTDMAKSGQGSMEMMFARNKGAAEDMYKSITVEAAKHFASAREGFMVLNRLAQSGYVVRQQEVGALLTLTDKIKLATQGQNVEMQLNTEIIALMQGQARAQSMLAMELQSRLGPGWKDLVDKHRAAGDLLTWITSLYPGLTAANREIEDTMNAQHATTKGLLELLAIGGLSGTYQDIVGWQKEINAYLRDHSKEIGGGIARGWEAVKDLAGGVRGFVQEIANVAKKGIVVPISFSIGGLGKFLSSGGQVEGGEYLAGGQDAGLGVPGVPAKQVYIPPQSDFGFGAMIQNNPDLNPEAKLKQNLEMAKEVEQYKRETFELYAKGLGAPEVNAPAGKATKGGGSGKDTTESAQASVAKFIETMKQETARGAGDTEAILTAWKNKQLQTLEELAAKGADIAKAKDALNEATASKQKKLDSDFNDWYIAGMGNQYEALVKQENKKLTEVTGNEIKTAQVHEVYAKKRAELDDQVNSNTMNLFKGYLDTMAGLNPTLEGQLKLKRESLALELKISDAALERQIREKQINPELADQARQMAAVAAQAKKFNLEMENNKGLQGWAYGRMKADQGKSTVSDMMGSFESGLQNSFSSAWQGFLTQDKKNLAKAGQSIFQGILGEVTKGSVTKLFSGFAKIISPQSPFGSAESDMGSGKGLTSTVSSTGAQLSKAAEGLNQASIGFNANTAQFGLAAGGLLLSGIGIATNSQAMVYAGIVLQVAGMAIQIYGALSATTTAVTMTVAAGALTGSAVALTSAATALMIAAAVDSIPFFHSGGIITAHQGWPRLAPDERIIRAQVGERVLSRAQNRDFEAGMIGGSGGGGTVVHAPISITIHPRQEMTQADYDRHARMIKKSLNKHIGTRGQGIGDGKG
jgi:hypothetical protein